MQLYIIRHAQSANNALYWETGSDIGRVPDPPLTDLGHLQAKALAGYLAGDAAQADNPFAGRHNRSGFGLTHLYCSLMIRAVQTGSYIAEATGLTLVAWPEIHERGGLHDIDEATGQDAGQPGPNRDFFAEHFPQLVLPDTLGDEGWWNRPPETVDEAIPRARAVWQRLMERHVGSHDIVAIVTHGGFFQSLLSVLVGAELYADAAIVGREHLWFGMINASVSRIEILEQAAVIRFINRVDFLPSELITG